MLAEAPRKADVEAAEIMLAQEPKEHGLIASSRVISKSSLPSRSISKLSQNSRSRGSLKSSESKPQTLQNSISDKSSSKKDGREGQASGNAPSGAKTLRTKRSGRMPKTACMEVEVDYSEDQCQLEAVINDLGLENVSKDLEGSTDERLDEQEKVENIEDFRET